MNVANHDNCGDMLVCLTEPHCACLEPAGDGFDEYSCECAGPEGRKLELVGAGKGRCVSCHAPLVTVAEYERQKNA
jgi:hypothetical protein